MIAAWVALGAVLGLAVRELVVLVRKALEVRAKDLQRALAAACEAATTAEQTRRATSEAWAAAKAAESKVDALERKVEALLVRAGLMQEMRR